MKLLAASLAVLATVATPALAEVKTVATLKPVHSLVSAVVGDKGTVGLIVDGANSPHTFSMRPSHAAMLQDADLVFRIDEEMELFLNRSLENLDAARVVTLSGASGITLKDFREADDFTRAAKDHDHHGHDDHKDDHHGHDDHKHDDHAHGHDEHKHDDHGHGHEEHAHKDHGHDDHGHKDHGHDDHGHGGHDDHGHHHGEHDMHVWLDPQNAIAMVRMIAASLSQADAANAASYEANATAKIAELEALNSTLAAKLAPVQGRSFVVFHDAYQYFEDRYGLTVTGAVTLNPEVLPGAGTVRSIRESLGAQNIACVFSEPQFNSQIVETLVEGTTAKSAVLDPLGAALEPGPDLYPALLTQMADAFSGCLAPSS